MEPLLLIRRIMAAVFAPFIILLGILLIPVFMDLFRSLGAWADYVIPFLGLGAFIGLFAVVYFFVKTGGFGLFE